jgi:hypothetical protein
MLIDQQASPSVENIYIRQSDHEILSVPRISNQNNPTVFNFLRRVLQVVTHSPPGGESNSICNFIKVVCPHFLLLSYRCRILRVKAHRQQQRRPLASKIFSMNSPTPTSYWQSVDIFRLYIIAFKLFASG